MSRGRTPKARGQATLLDAQVDVIALAAGLVGGDFLDDEVLVAFLYRRRQGGYVEQPGPGGQGHAFTSLPSRPW